MIIVAPVSEEMAERQERGLCRGESVRFTFKGSAVHVFDKESGKNLEYI